MKLNKEQFFSKLKKGEVKTFTYKGVKYFAESVSKTKEYTGTRFAISNRESWFNDIIKLKPSEADIRDLKIGSGYFIKVKKNSPQEKFLKLNQDSKKLNIYQLTKEDYSNSEFAKYVKIDNNASYFALDKEKFKDLKRAIEFIKKLPDDSVDLYTDIPFNEKGWRK